LLCAAATEIVSISSRRTKQFLGVIRHFPPIEISLVLGSALLELKKNGSYVGASPLIPGYPDSFIFIRTSNRKRT
jgi:hypothetical protein